MPKKISTIQQQYRVAKIINDKSAPLGTTYNPEEFVDGGWRNLMKQYYSLEEAVEYLKLLDAIKKVKIEYIYPVL